ncbi:IPTL-CTERM sorting domain-containing protein [Curvibacter sp. HBC28]|uniref:IPTL-CTERM sorting domain-containing protein n=1 Tax=Curvibacter microcysteis TaxID=3026419 RepID=A0ABT5MDU1_9BURK|nr:IPTL-CTERM sorting domain-containing protein [Curvibacter sp. HBC28]MDD0814749.1 IPTL-CTERM sorting domain-containing protein [Curvibacter sp. HBC28]
MAFKFFRPSALALALALAGLSARADLVITEAMSNSAPTVTADWFELSNTGNTVVSLSGLKMDDNSYLFSASVAMAGLDAIGPGESVIFIEGNASAITAFRNKWGAAFPRVRVGTYSGSSVGLSATSDGVVVFDSTGTELTRQGFGAATPGSSFGWTSNNSAATVSTAADSHGSVASNGDVGSPGRRSNATVPSAPVTQAASAVTGTGFTANWQAGANASSHVLELSTDNFSTLLRADGSSGGGGIALTAASLSQAISGLSGDVCVSYRVLALNEGGASAYSDTRQVPLNAGSCGTPPVFTGLSNNTPLSGVVGDSRDHYANTGTVFSVSDAVSAANALVVSASSSNAAVVANSGLSVSNSNGTVTLKVTPVGVGYADITVTVRNEGNASASRVIKYAASSSASANASTVWPSGRSDLSTAVKVDDNHVLLADDEPANQIMLFDRRRSGPAVAVFPLTSIGGTMGVGAGANCESITGASCDGETDLEAGFALGTRVYWTGSHSNNKNGGIRPDRWRLFATDLIGSGAGTTLSFVGYYKHLRTDLLAWDNANGHQLGAAYLGLSTSAGAGLAPESANLDGFSIEGMTVSPNSAAAWLGFRAPLVAAPGQGAATAGSSTGRTHALLIPVTNFNTLLQANGGTAGSATFGTPIRLNLGGRGIREIRRTVDNQYLIIAGPPDGATGVAPKDFRLYTWDGSVGANGEATNLALRSTALTSLLGGMSASPEGLIEPSTALTDNVSIGILSDAGDVVFYGDGTAAKDLSDPYRKSRLDTVTLGSTASYVDTDGVSDSTESQVPSASGGGTGDGNGDGTPDNQQAHVASLPTAIGSGFATVVSAAGRPLSAVAANALPQDAPATASTAPYGAFSFTASGIPVVLGGSTENFELFLPYHPQINGALKKNRLTNQWVNVATSVVQVGNKTKISFSLTDGGAFDTDASINGQIQDPIIPVILPAVASVPTLSTWGLLSLSTVLAATGWGAQRRRRGTLAGKSGKRTAA